MSDRDLTKFRGNLIYTDATGECRYADTHELTAPTWKERPCGYCLMPNRPDEHDACLGELPGVINACCGHGESKKAYIQFEDKEIKRGEEAIDEFLKEKGLVFNGACYDEE